jgi:hypothetical protein
LRFPLSPDIFCGLADWQIETKPTYNICKVSFSGFQSFSAIKNKYAELLGATTGKVVY